MSTKDIVVRIFFFSLFAFSFFLMFQTFSYREGEFLLGTKLWSDFASHIPLIRSFTFGWNFPPQYPIFSNEPIHYHFVFYMIIGLFEKIGIPLTFTLNTLSALGFFSLLVMIYFFAKLLFKSRIVGILSVLFFLFNGSFSFIYFFQKNPLSLSTIQDVLTNTSFYSFAPYYGDGIVSAFWNLNIFTNQRHFALAFTISLFILYQTLNPIFSSRKLKLTPSILLGLLLGATFYFHIAVFMMTVITLLCIFLFFSQIRSQIFIMLSFAFILFYPQYSYMNSGGSAFSIQFRPGYLISENLTFFNFLKYWLFNLGLHSFLLFLGFFFADKNQKKVFLAFFSMFIIGNLFQFSPEMAANHKFFNFFMIIGAMYSAYIIGKMYHTKLLKPIAGILFILLTLSGIIDLFPILNDTKISISDYQKNKTSEWIIHNTPPDSIFLNHTYLFAPESIAGRKIFLGWPYFAWSAGYDTEERSNHRNLMFSSSSKTEICTLLIKNNLQYIEINNSQKNNPDQPKISGIFEKEFYLEYKNENYKIFNTQKSCNK